MKALNAAQPGAMPTVEDEVGVTDPCSEQKIAQFRTHDLTKELACVSTQQSGQVTMETK
jgi:hypothetical protein